MPSSSVRSHRNGPEGRLSIAIALAQVTCAVTWVVGATLPGRVWVVPDKALTLLLPALMACLAVVGIVGVCRARGNGLLTATTVFSVAVLALALLVILFLPAALPDF